MRSWRWYSKLLLALAMVIVAPVLIVWAAVVAWMSTVLVTGLILSWVLFPLRLWYSDTEIWRMADEAAPWVVGTVLAAMIVLVVVAALREAVRMLRTTVLRRRFARR